MLKNVSATEMTLFVDRGDTYYKEFNISDGILPLDLSGYILKFEIKEYAGVKLFGINFTVEAPMPISGAISIVGNAEETILMYKPRYVYRLVAILPAVQPEPPVIPPLPPIETVVLMFGQIIVSNF